MTITLRDANGSYVLHGMAPPYSLYGLAKDLWTYYC